VREQFAAACDCAGRAVSVNAVASKPSLRRSERQLGAKAQFASPIGDFCNKICQERTHAAQQTKRIGLAYSITSSAR
jgi:hypothetical protein